MLSRFPYRVQIPLGLSMAVVLAALLVTAVSTRIAAGNAHQATLDTVDRTVALLSAQARPALATEDIWNAFVLLRNAAPLLPGAAERAGRVALLDPLGRVMASSLPDVLETGTDMFGRCRLQACLPQQGAIRERWTHDDGRAGLRLVEPVRSDDGQVLGFVYIEIDPSVFDPDWAASSKPALIGALLSIAVLVPAGWWVGQQMTRPVARVARVIERITRGPAMPSLNELPRSPDPELGRISEAVAAWIAEQATRQRAEQRALSAERMATVGRMTAAVAHEINNPLGGLLNATQTLRVHGASEATRERTLDLLQRGLNQIRTTVAALLPQARIEDRWLEPSDLDDVLTLAQPLAISLGVTVTAEVAVETAMRVPSAVVRQVMLNMLLNAIKAAGRDGKVQARLSADEAKVRVEITNSGASLSRHGLEQGIASESGNDPRGFGLWVCRELAIQFGGGFELDEQYKQGTRLKFWMPNRDRDEIRPTD